jgi:hypothetical protein
MKLRLFSDGCVGQNKNHTMVRLYMALVDTGMFVNVQQSSPVRGQSYVCDRNFGHVRGVLRRVDRVYSVK